MALVPLATKGDNNPFHRSRAQVKDITAYLKNGGTLEKAAAMANHASTRTTSSTIAGAMRSASMRSSAL